MAMDYDSIIFSEGKKLSELIQTWHESVNNRHDLIKLFDSNNINSESNSIIKFTIINLELCLGIGQKPVPTAVQYLRSIDPMRKYLWLRKKLKLNEFYSLDMTHFQDNSCRDQHKNSFGTFEITINLSELYAGIHKLFKTEYNLEDESDALFIGFFHDDEKIFNKLCNKYSPETITKFFNHINDKLKDDEDNISLFTNFLKYRNDKKGY